MKSVTGFIIVLFVFSIAAAKGQSVNTLLIGTWQVSADSLNHNDTGKGQLALVTPVNDVWKFTADTLYYKPAFIAGVNLKCHYTISGDTILCNGQPAYKFKLTNSATLELQSGGLPAGAGLYNFITPDLVIYLIKQNN